VIRLKPLGQTSDIYEKNNTTEIILIKLFINYHMFIINKLSLYTFFI